VSAQGTSCSAATPCFMGSCLGACPQALEIDDDRATACPPGGDGLKPPAECLAGAPRLSGGQCPLHDDRSALQLLAALGGGTPGRPPPRGRSRIARGPAMRPVTRREGTRPCWRVTGPAHGGECCPCRMRATAGADPLAHALRNRGGEVAVWCADHTATGSTGGHGRSRRGRHYARVLSHHEEESSSERTTTENGRWMPRPRARRAPTHDHLYRVAPALLLWTARVSGPARGRAADGTCSFWGTPHCPARLAACPCRVPWSYGILGRRLVPPTPPRRCGPSPNGRRRRCVLAGGILYFFLWISLCSTARGLRVWLSRRSAPSTRRCR